MREYPRSDTFGISLLLSTILNLSISFLNYICGQINTCLSMKYLHTLLLLFTTAIYLPVNAQRETKTINDGWLFNRNNDFAEAQIVNIPHTWNTDAYVVKDYYKGKGFYRKAIHLPLKWSGKHLYLTFEGVSKYARIIINGQDAGEHKGGYTAFTLDITPFCRLGEENEITVIADNAREDIAPISGDFTFFGGIYRDVWLTAVPAQHFNRKNAGSGGVFIDTPQVSEEKSTLQIRGEVTNAADREKTSLELVHTLYHPDGTLLQTRSQTIRLKAGETRTFNSGIFTVSQPRLWTPESPCLYKVESVLRDRKTKAVLDCYEHSAGFRWFSFDGGNGFFLNGKPYKLRGMCRHQDQKPTGVALTDEMHRRDMKLIKEMGANFIRISHYPQDEAILEMCDKLGLLAWEEIPIIDIVPDTPDYAENCEQNLREMIRQHYNHPSIIIWGYMNEILLVTQRRYKTEAEQKPILERTLALAERLEKVLKEEDATRVSAMAFHGSDSYNTVGLSKITDIVGWNLYQGWYGGDLGGFERFLAEQHRNYPAHPMLVSEYGAGSDRRLHSLQPCAFDFSIEYQQQYLEHYLPVLEETSYVSGGTHWNFIDFSSALRDESMPRINNKGLVDAGRVPKDVYYYYQAVWRKDIPVLHIASRDWMRRGGVQKEDSPVALPVKIYTNLSEVELWIDGQSLGKQKVNNCTATFNVPFRQGEPFLLAGGQYRGESVQDGLKIHFTPTPSRLTGNSLKKNLELAVNVGSRCFYTSDESFLTWLPDQPYTQGGWGYIGGKEQSTQTEIMNTLDGPLLQTLRQGIEGYRFDLPRGTYEVELLFADIFRQKEGIAYQLGREGQRESGESRFDICVNGKVIEGDFSPCRESGSFRMLRKKYIINNEEDHIEVNFHRISGESFLNGIKLRNIY